MKLISAFALLSTATAIADVAASPPVHGGSLRGRALDNQDASLGPLPKGPSVPCRTNVVRCPKDTLAKLSKTWSKKHPSTGPIHYLPISSNGKLVSSNGTLAELSKTHPLISPNRTLAELSKPLPYAPAVERIENCQNEERFLIKVDDTCWLSQNDWEKAPRFSVAFELPGAKIGAKIALPAKVAGVVENMHYLRSTGLPATAGCESLCYKSVYAHSTTKNATAMIHQLMDSQNFMAYPADNNRKFGYFVGYCGKDVKSNLQSCAAVYH